MKKIVLQSTSTAQWYTLVNEAEDLVGKHLATDLESYLVFMLQRFTNKPDFTGSLLAFDYLDSLESTGKQRADKLRDMGDKCVLFCGFYPELAGKRHVTVSYFVDMGRSAYNYLAAIRNEGLLTSKLYDLLRAEFIHLVDLLLFIRELNGQSPVLNLMQAEDLWRHTRSQYAFKVLKKHNNKVIVPQEATLLQLH